MEPSAYSSESAPDPASRIAAFMRGASFEVTRARDKDIGELREALPAGTRIFVAALPGRPMQEIADGALALRRAGLEPVPHIAARHHPDLTSVERLLLDLRAADVREVLLVGGDVAPAGSVRDAMSVIESGLLQKHGIARVGLPGFPDGHPQMSDEEIESTLVTKAAALQSAGLSCEIVTQFCFDARPVVAWLGWLRQRGLTMPVRIGFAGPTSLMTWLNYARRCGVKASAEALASRSGLVKHAFKAVAPDPFVRAVADAVTDGKYGEVRAHLFSFGGAGATARWAAAPMAGRIRLTGDGFEAA